MPGSPNEGLLYAVASRRAGGLSIGVDLFRGAKVCNYDCPYCEVFPRNPEPTPSLREGFDALAGRLRAEGREARARDISIAGSGEPTLSPLLAAALAEAAEARRRHPEVFGAAGLTLITNATGFLDRGILELVGSFVEREGLRVWAKLDGGDEDAQRAMSRSAFPLARIAGGILDFSRRWPLSLQAMVCALAERPGGHPLPPPAAWIADWSRLVAGLLVDGARIDHIQLYTMARPSPWGLCAPLPDGELLGIAEDIAAGLRAALAGRREPPPIGVFGSAGELPFETRGPAARDAARG